MNAAVALIAAEIAFSNAVLVGMRPSDEQKAARTAAIEAKKSSLEVREMPSSAAYKAIVTRSGFWRVFATPADVADALVLRAGGQLADENGERAPSIATAIISTFADAFASRAERTLEDLAASDRKQVVIAFDAQKMSEIASMLSDEDVSFAESALEVGANDTRLGLAQWDVAQAQARLAAKEQRELAKAA
ncbi:MAG TPA: hypothetical protein P5256_01625 [Beijerinckiaceae bacterium]|nr:hypothetical protein [Rhodoblastus sp.]MCC2106177.1 hypothetical protein [Hyphomicrobiales bacterium]HRY01795.1 hypothetical protein [Beijerinckiaceae bacterium]